MVAAATALAAVNVSKQNNSRGTYAFAVKPDGSGGIDLDVSVGAALLLIAAVAPSSVSPHLAALGVGALSTFGSRMGANYGAKHAQMAQTTAGIPGHGYLRGFDQRYLPGPVDPLASRYGFQPSAAGVAAVRPLYDHAHFPGSHRF